MKSNILELMNNLEDKDKFEELITLLVQKGIINTESEEIIKNVIDISDTIVREIMVPRTEMVALSLDSDLNQVLAIFHECKHSRIPVYEENIDNIVGFIYSKDLLLSNLQDTQFSLKKYLRPAYFVPETKKILLLLKEFKEKKVHTAVVVDEFGGVCGLVTLGDIMEEIIGDFVDEFQEIEESLIKKLDEKQYLIDAKCPIEDISEELDIDFEEGPYDTIGGYIIKELGKIPEKKETIENSKFTITVNEVYEKGIKNLIIDIK